MKIEDYLKKKDMTINKFAEIIDVHRTYISDIIHRRAKPSLALMIRIEEATNGEVSVDEMLEYFHKRKKKQ